MYKNILTYGTFDLLHYGHLNILMGAKALGKKLYVGLSSDAFNQSKGKTSFLSYEKRYNLLQELKSVNHIFPELNWQQKRDDIKKYQIDCFVMGSDWEGKFGDLKDLCEVVYIKRTKDISSTLIKNSLI